MSRNRPAFAARLVALQTLGHNVAGSHERARGGSSSEERPRGGGGGVAGRERLYMPNYAEKGGAEDTCGRGRRHWAQGNR